jgi:hypothetical protein
MLGVKKPIANWKYLRYKRAGVFKCMFSGINVFLVKSPFRELNLKQIRILTIFEFRYRKG